VQSKRTAQKCDDIVRPLSKGKVVMYVYLITNNKSNSVYVGITRTSLDRRFSAHKWAAKHGKKSILYSAMREYGIENFSISLLKHCDSEEELLNSEIHYVSYFRELLGKTYNILDGGEPYFPIVDKDSWKAKLRSARAGRTPAKGMKHSLENRELFKKVSREYWSTQSTYDESLVVKLSFAEAHKLYNISKTHYYRLKNKHTKQAGNNDPS
jgi:group I intron endonuclease